MTPPTDPRIIEARRILTDLAAGAGRDLKAAAADAEQFLRDVREPSPHRRP